MKYSIPFLSWAAAAHANTNGLDISKSSARNALLKAQHIKNKQQAAFKRQKLQSANTLRNFKPSFMQQNDLDCDWTNDEICYDENWNEIGCEPYASGGCPCPAGQEKCGLDIDIGWSGYCTEPEFCCEADEELCYDDDYNPTGCKLIADGGCPCKEGEEKCGGYCTAFCCSDEEETCLDENWNAIGCAALSDGGCECPEGEEKCGATDWWPGTCTSLCCADDEETCLDANYEPTECKSIASGGCDCPDGQVKCNADPESNYAGWCADVCCDSNTQETCYDYETFEESCADIVSGGCPCPEGEEKCGASEYWAGYCTAPEYCCGDDEELCYSNDWWPQPESCAPIDAGGCPCPDGESKCGASDGYAGYCTSLCCEEQTCYDWTTYEPTSCVSWEETCPTGISFGVLKRKAMSMIDKNVMKSYATSFQKIKARKAKMSVAEDGADVKNVEKMIQAEEIAVLRKIKNTGARKSSKKDVPAFMTKVN